MKLVRQSHEIIDQAFPGKTAEMTDQIYKKELLKSAYKQVEIAARTCYKSEDRITDTSYEPLIQALLNSGHMAMFEHGAVYLRFTPAQFEEWWDTPDLQHPYYRITKNSTDVLVSTNLRYLFENEWIEKDILQFITYPQPDHIKRHSIRFITDLLVSQELVRHRVMSWAMESTRYCNYSQGKFGNQLTFILPKWDNEKLYPWPAFFQQCEDAYFNHLKLGWKPQQAAILLPKALKTELIMTGFEDEFVHFFDLRVLGTTGAPHPQMIELITPLYEEFKKLGYVN